MFHSNLDERRYAPTLVVFIRSQQKVHCTEGTFNREEKKREENEVRYPPQMLSCDVVGIKTAGKQRMNEIKQSEHMSCSVFVYFFVCCIYSVISAITFFYLELRVGGCTNQIFKRTKSAIVYI